MPGPSNKERKLQLVAKASWRKLRAEVVSHDTLIEQQLAAQAERLTALKAEVAAFEQESQQLDALAAAVAAAERRRDGIITNGRRAAQALVDNATQQQIVSVCISAQLGGMPSRCPTSPPPRFFLSGLYHADRHAEPRSGAED